MRTEQLDRYLARAELKAFTPKSITKTIVGTTIDDPYPIHFDKV